MSSGSESRVPQIVSMTDDIAISIKVDCLQAARSNCKILLDLCKHGKIGRCLWLLWPWSGLLH